VKLTVVAVMLGTALFFLFMGSQASDAFVYSKLVSEVVLRPNDFADRELRVEGDLEQGSVRFREQPCEWRFVLGDAGHRMPVRFPQCVVPDTFRDGPGLTVTVQGRYHPEGYFLANQVIPRCPSKYDMEEMESGGTARPH
jgi:cytochrome c-type biogenesis protein CcmE